MKNKTITTLAVTSLVISCAQASTITFSTPTRISSDSDVSTTGALEYAFGFAGSDTTVNGVTFLNSGNNTNFGGTGQITATAFNNRNATAFAGTGLGAAPFNSLSANYQSLLSGATFTGANGASSTITLNNLTSLQEYQVQIFISDSRNLAGNDLFDRQAIVTSGANSVTLDYNDNGTLLNDNGTTTNGVGNGGVGQFVTGTFIADAATQQFTIATPGAGINGLQLNAIQVRAIPEPSSTILIGIGSLACMIRRKRN